jgi:putative tryptophan/tyrosine transport system substrate-binding protein
VRRREFITLLGGAAAAWPLAARAQQQERMRRIAVLMGWSESDPQFRSWIEAFVQELARLGWADGRNVHIDVRWTSGDVGRIGTFAKELVELQPNVILGGTTPVTAALQRETRTIPIVFVVVADPVGPGFVAGLPRPGGNITGFLNAEAAMGGKWLEILKEIAPRLTRVAIMFNPDTAPGGGAYFLGAFEAAARSLAVEPLTARVRSDAEIEAVIASLGPEQGGLVIMTDSFMGVHRGTVISLAARNKVPVIGADLPSFAREGGLLSYGANLRDIFRRAAPYVDRILRGANPGDLPVQGPVKYEMVVNLKTAKALGIEVPPTLLARADEVIE